jgi:hypothetical protein
MLNGLEDLFLLGYPLVLNCQFFYVLTRPMKRRDAMNKHTAERHGLVCS